MFNFIYAIIFETRKDILPDINVKITAINTTP